MHLSNNAPSRIFSNAESEQEVSNRNGGTRIPNEVTVGLRRDRDSDLENMVDESTSSWVV